MTRVILPLNALRAFEASARHRSFTRAAEELFVTQAAISHHVKALEARLGARLFHRTPQGLMLTDEGVALLPALTDSFTRIARVLDRFQGGQMRDVLTLSVVGTFAVGWLLPRLAAFREAHPFVDLRLLTNNNRVDLSGEGLDGAILFGSGDWPGLRFHAASRRAAFAAVHAGHRRPFEKSRAIWRARRYCDPIGCRTGPNG